MNGMIKFAVLKALNGKSGYRETTREGVITGQIKGGGVLDCDRGRGDGNKWVELRSVWEMKLVGLDNEICRRREKWRSEG